MLFRMGPKQVFSKWAQEQGFRAMLFRMDPKLKHSHRCSYFEF